jgi:hypothetical protein
VGIPYKEAESLRWIEEHPGAAILRPLVELDLIRRQWVFDGDGSAPTFTDCLLSRCSAAAL